MKCGDQSFAEIVNTMLPFDKKMGDVETALIDSLDGLSDQEAMVILRLNPAIGEVFALAFEHCSTCDGRRCKCQQKFDFVVGKIKPLIDVFEESVRKRITVVLT